MVKSIARAGVVRLRRLAAFAVACLALTPGAHAETGKKSKPPPPLLTDRELGFFDNTRAEMLASIKRVGILPVELPPGFRDHQDKAQAALTSAVTKYLELAGFDVVGLDTYRAAHDRFNKLVGGIYDPVTGELRPQQAADAQANAKREFVSKEHLDGFVSLRVVPRQARYYLVKSVWDGVVDHSGGKKPRGALGEFFLGHNTSGALPALSLLVQIVTVQDRVAFGRFGGIQTTAYVDDSPGAQMEFLSVNPDELLKDATRFDRAAQFATQPLVHTPEEISLGDEDPRVNPAKIDLDSLAPLPAGTPLNRESPFLVPRDQILKQVHRIALSGLAAEPFKVPGDVRDRLIADIKSEIATLGWEVVDAPLAADLLARNLSQAHLFDPYTGARDDAKANAIREAAISSLGIDPAPDAILWIGLARSMALHRMGDVEWDGVNQSGFTLGPVRTRQTEGNTAKAFSGSAGIPALSITTYLADAHGNGLYSSRGGLHLLQKLKYVAPTRDQPGRADPSDLDESELFARPWREKPAVHAALRDLVLTPQELYEEVHPLKIGEKRKVKRKT